MEVKNRRKLLSAAAETQKWSFLDAVSRFGVSFLLLQLKDIKCYALEKK
jgi:hypothetical protein